MIALLLIAATPQIAADIAVTTQTIPRGGAVNSANVRVVAKASRKMPRMFRPHIWQPGENLRARRTLRKGVILSRFDVELMPDVSAGDPVLVEIVRGSMRVTAAAIAKEDGFIGEAIWVQNEKSRRRMRVRVVDTGRVQLYGRRR